MIETLKILREENHYSQATIATYLGISRQMYIKYENGDVEPSVQIIKQLSKLYKVSYEVILDNKLKSDAKTSLYEDTDNSTYQINEPAVSYGANPVSNSSNYDLAVSAISSLDIFEKIKLIGLLAEAINKGTNSIIAKEKTYSKLNNLSKKEKESLLDKYSGSLKGIEIEHPYDAKIDYLTKKYDL